MFTKHCGFGYAEPFSDGILVVSSTDDRRFHSPENSPHIFQNLRYIVHTQNPLAEKCSEGNIFEIQESRALALENLEEKMKSFKKYVTNVYERLWRGRIEAECGGLLNRYTALKPYRGFESLPLRQLNHQLNKG